MCPQLCCLHADMLSSLGPKEAKKAFLDFYHSFLEKTAVRYLPSVPLLMSTCGAACQCGPPQCLLSDPSHQDLLRYICHLTPFSPEQVLRVPVPPNVAFELGKKEGGVWG